MRVINFNPGPAALPLSALERARDELLDFQGSGMSIMEHSHRGAVYEAVHNEAIALLRELLGVPDSHYVLFMQGGGHLQFAQVPMNFLPPGQTADYIITGHWSKVALEEAQNIGKVRVAATTEENKRFNRVPKPAEIKLDPAAAYVHLTSNNTLYGTQWHSFPDTGKVPLVADMSSDILWNKLDVSKFGLIYAGAQKNMGPSGVTAVLARKDLVDGGERKDVPKILRYSTFAKNNSLYNTPPTFGIYLMRNVLLWVKGIGGLEAMGRRNLEKGKILYDALDRMAAFYKAPVEKESRSYMNVVFRLPTEALDEKFVNEAKKAGMVGLKGHRSAGGIRASTYNAVSPEDVRTLVSFMDGFAKANG
jgi:phosphoserine aminotransferase